MSLNFQSRTFDMDMEKKKVVWHHIPLLVGWCFCVMQGVAWKLNWSGFERAIFFGMMLSSPPLLCWLSGQWLTQWAAATNCFSGHSQISQATQSSHFPSSPFFCHQHKTNESKIANGRDHLLGGNWFHKQPYHHICCDLHLLSFSLCQLFIINAKALPSGYSDVMVCLWLKVVLFCFEIMLYVTQNYWPSLYFRTNI